MSSQTLTREMAGHQTLPQVARFVLLDGVRGFAAVSVLIYHLGHWLQMPTLAANGGLAVDLFFCLSGFVLPFAYRKRVNALSLAAFMRTRLVRLMPLIVLAIAISAAYVILRNRIAAGGIPYSAAGAAILLGLVNLPYFGAPSAIGGPELYPLNGPQYTLFLELLVNLFWWGTRRVNQIRLSVILAALCFLPLTAMGLGGDLPSTFLGGFPRVGASFFAGVALFHLEPKFPLWAGWTPVFWMLFVVMAGLFYMPVQASLGVQLVWVAVISPLLVLAGARAHSPPTAHRLCLFLGSVSYPVYALHYPIFCWINGLYRSHFGPRNIAVEGPVIAAMVTLFSFLILKIYDEPLRRRLS